MTSPHDRQPTRLSDAQRRALALIAPAPMARGFFSGWGPHHCGYGAHRIDVTEPTSKVLLRLGMVEIVGAGKDATLAITPAGRAALALYRGGQHV